MFRPARHYAKVKGWVPKGIASFLVYASLSTVLPFMWDAWHRTMHANDFLWRWFHQMHHSAERVDVAGAFYFSPLDMVGWTFLGSLALVWAVGVTPQAAVLVNLALTFTAMFSHRASGSVSSERAEDCEGYDEYGERRDHQGQADEGFRFNVLALPPSP